MKVLGIGNALVDALVSLKNDDILKNFNLPKGGMTLVEKELAQKVLDASKALDIQMASGGSAANTIHGLANLGIETGFIGTVGNDERGRFFEEDMKTASIKPFLKSVSHFETGTAVTLISPDGERTFATYLGAAIDMNPENLDDKVFELYDYLHIEGYLVQNQFLVRKACEIARDKGLIISIDLASFTVVEGNLEFLKEIVNQYVDIVFANEEEAKAFTGNEPEKALNIIADMCDIAVVKIGDKGSLIKRGSDITTVGIIQANCIDTTGAGDLYAAGFLYGLIKNYSLEKCGDLGAILSGNVIEHYGAKISEVKWKDIIDQL